MKKYILAKELNYSNPHNWVTNSYPSKTNKNLKQQKPILKVTNKQNSKTSRKKTNILNGKT